jgi:hypothetical protein
VGDDAEGRGWREAAAALADELRASIESLATSDLGAQDLEEAARLARELRRRLVGPRRPRWYEGGGGGVRPAPAQRDAFQDQSPLRGRLNPVAPPLELGSGRRQDGSPCVVGRVRLGLAYEGPPHGVHGGVVAALFDEVLGAAQPLAGAPGVTAILRVRYRDITPIEEDLVFEAWIAERRERRMVARATCRAGENVTADAEGIFVQVDFDDVQRRMQERRTGHSS